MDITDIAEKESGKKAAAAGTEQPAKEVKNSEVSRGKWNSINFARALLQSGVSRDACKMALYIHINQGGKWKFYQDVTCKETGLSRIKFYECLSELEDVNAIERKQSRNGNRNGKGVFLKWNFDYKSWKTKTESSQNEKSQNEKSQNKKSQNKKSQNENYQNEKSQNDHCINIDKDLISPPGNSEHSSNDLTSLNSEHKEKGEGAAAEPPHGPAFSESAPKKTGSTGEAQEQPRPFMAADYSEEDPAQEKPKKKPKGKGKAAGEIEIPEVEEIKSYIAGYIQENHKKGVHSYIWTVSALLKNVSNSAH